MNRSTTQKSGIKMFCLLVLFVYGVKMLMLFFQVLNLKIMLFGYDGQMDMKHFTLVMDNMCFILLHH